MEAMQQTPLKGNNFGVDRINELTDDLLFHILSFMTIKDAAKTSILSTRWRYLWAFRSNFSFDLPTLLGSKLPVRRYLEEDKDIMQLDKCRFIHRMDHILKLYRGPKIESFEITFFFTQESARHVDQWISFAAKEGVENLVLNFFSGHYVKGGSSTDYGKSYVFPWWIFSQENRTHLKHLHLEECNLRLPPFFHGFHCLITLHLDYVVLREGDVENLLANTSKLEKLTMLRCSLPRHCRLISPFMKLKFLRIINCRNFMKIVLSAPSLVSFEYMGRNMSSIIFMNVPCLVEVLFDARSLDHVFTQLPKAVPSLETMILQIRYLEAQSLPTSISITPFSSVKCLEVNLVSAKNDPFWAIPILNAVPLLQKLHLVLRTQKYYKDEGNEKINCAHHHRHLQVVEITGFTPSRSQIEFAKFVLRYALALEKLVINPKARSYAGFDGWFDFQPLVQWTEDERSMLLQTLQRRSSLFSFLWSEQRNSNVNIVIM